jgi:hypothetical protein
MRRLQTIRFMCVPKIIKAAWGYPGKLSVIQTGALADCFLSMATSSAI